MLSFFLVYFNILSLSLIFVRLTTMCLDVFLLEFFLPGTLCTSWSLLTISFIILWKFLDIIFSNIFLVPFSLSSFWDPYDMNIGAFNVVSEVSYVVFVVLFFFFHFFPLYYVLQQ